MKLSLGNTLFCLVLMIGASLILAERNLDASDQAKEKVTPPSPGSEITVNECRIKLIDRVILGSDRPGVLEFVEPNEGEQVKKGQVIAALKSDALKASRKTAEKRSSNDIEIRYSKKARDTAYVELEMNLDINKRVSNTISKLDIKRLQLNAEKSDLQIEQAELEFAMSKLQLEEIDAQIEETKVTAPFDGIVTKKFRSTGEVVRHGDEVLELVSTKRVKVEGYVNIDDTWKFQIGTPVEVQLDIPGIRLPIENNKYTGRIVFVDVEVEPIHGKSIRVWAEVENPENVLKAGYMATMKIMPDKTENKVAAETSVKK
ncbi:putative efflux pump membrane fusion protein [Gimesia alba]|uniref:Putative efflux pump membrane fusion protein n=1 Tax=Gimesia alba TaxID=2527973 RepID=A0A517RHC4_9PLAN|nr:HlyD family efflux transporter periplasmic adaptor subunit [Gimesia alba]QDT43268.1 putative efflux pump membrane fusion protein [Gimesia alba]